MGRGQGDISLTISRSSEVRTIDSFPAGELTSRSHSGHSNESAALRMPRKHMKNCVSGDLHYLDPASDN